MYCHWLWEYFSFINVLVGLLSFVFMTQLWELYKLRGMPPGARLIGIPFVGNFLSFDRGGVTIRDLTRSLRQKYGSVFTVKLGCYVAVFVSSPEGANEVLIKNSKDFAGRPPLKSVSGVAIGGVPSVLYGNYGAAWKVHKRLLYGHVRHFLRDTSIVNQLITEEAINLLTYLNNKDGKAFDPDNLFVTATTNFSGTSVLGKAFTLTSDFRELLDIKEETLQPGNYRLTLLLLDFFPFFTEFFNTFKELKKSNARLFGLIRRQLKTRERAFNAIKQSTDDFCGGLLKARNEARMELEEIKSEVLSSDETLIGLLEDLFSSGYETTSTTLICAWAFLVNYPDFQTEMQSQIDDVVGRDRLPNLDDSPNLPLVHAFILETLRVSNIVDSTLPHYTLKDTSLCGYRIPKDTIVVVDVGSVHVDPKIWQNPKEFNPHRHLDINGNVVTEQRNLFSFSGGRRKCIGEQLAKMEMFLILSILIHQFSFVPADGEPLPQLVGVRGITISPKPYKISAIKRK